MNDPCEKNKKDWSRVILNIEYKNLITVETNKDDMNVTLNFNQDRINVIQPPIAW
jgi:hypothetical protein